MPKLWNDTIEAHRIEVRQAIIDSAGALVAENGLMSMTMSRIAEDAGIGRATLYKYFPDIEAIVSAWHESEVSGHLRHLEAVRDNAETPVEALRAVLEAYGLVVFGSRGHRDTEIAVLMHRDGHVLAADEALRGMVSELLVTARPIVREDIGSDELASYCLHALSGAAGLESATAVRRLVKVCMTGLRNS